MLALFNLHLINVETNGTRREQSLGGVISEKM